MSSFFGWDGFGKNSRLDGISSKSKIFSTLWEFLRDLGNSKKHRGTDVKYEAVNAHSCVNRAIVV